MGTINCMAIVYYHTMPVCLLRQLCLGTQIQEPKWRWWAFQFTDFPFKVVRDVCTKFASKTTFASKKDQ